MIRAALIGCVASCVFFGAQIAVPRLVGLAAQKNTAAASRVEARKTKEINVPIIRRGAVMGYVVVQINYYLNTASLEQTSLTPDPIVSDEVFRYLYDDQSIDFDKLETYDLRKMYSDLLGRINTRLKAKVVTDMGVQEFTFVPSTATRPRGTGPSAEP